MSLTTSNSPLPAQTCKEEFLSSLPSFALARFLIKNFTASESPPSSASKYEELSTARMDSRTGATSILRMLGVFATTPAGPTSKPKLMTYLLGLLGLSLEGWD